MKEYKIYTLSCSKTKEVRYIGVTTRTLDQRFYQHAWNSKKGHLPINKWMRKMKANNLKVEIKLLDKVREKVWEKTEKNYISQFKKRGVRLLNVDSGGHGLVRGRRHLSELKKCRKVDQYSMNGTFIQTFPSLTQAAKSCNLKSRSSFTNHLISNHGRHVGGFRWAYHGEKPKAYRRIIVTHNRKQIVYPDLLHAAESHGFCRNKMRKLLEESEGKVLSKKNLLIEYDIV